MNCLIITAKKGQDREVNGLLQDPTAGQGRPPGFPAPIEYWTMIVDAVTGVDQVFIE